MPVPFPDDGYIGNGTLLEIKHDVNEVIGREREENVESFVNTERSGLEGDRRSSIYRRNLNFYPTNKDQNDGHGIFGFLSILNFWDLRIQIYLSTKYSVPAGLTTSPGKLTPRLMRNSSPNCDSIISQNTMPPNNTTLASQALNQVRENQASSNEKEGNSGSVKSTEYSTVRKFLENDVLHEYLARKAPNLIRLEERCYTLYDVLLALREIVSREKLFDANNPTVIICSTELENALDMKALHVTEIKHQVCKHFVSDNSLVNNISESNSKLTTNIESTTVPVGPGNLSGSTDCKNVSYSQTLSTEISCQSSTLRRTDSLNSSIQTQHSNDLNDLCPTKIKSDFKEEEIKNGSSLSRSNSITAGESDAVLSEVSKQQREAMQNNLSRQLSRDAPLSLEGRFMVKPSFLHIIRKVNGVDPKKVIFTFKELTHHLSQYILQNRSKFFDKRNHMVAICEGDILAEAFGVRAFHRSQVTNLLKSQLIPYHQLNIPQNQSCDKMNINERNISTSSSNDKGASRKRCPQMSSDDEMDDDGGAQSNKSKGRENSASYQFVKRQRRRTSSQSRSISVTVTSFDYSSSGDETIYSAQGYETVAVGDMDEIASVDEYSGAENLDEETKESIRAKAAAAAADAVAEEIPADTPESNDSSDNVFEIEDVYQVEYEPESEVDTEIDEKADKTGKKAKNNASFSDSDTDLEDVIVVAATLFEFTDIAEWADSSDTEASDSGIETPGAASKVQSTSNDARQSSDESVETIAKALKCISCDEPDEYLHPLMKECHSCWQKRRGNMPDRPKPRRKKNKGKGKNSNGQKIKSSGSFIQNASFKATTLDRMPFNSEHTSSSHTSDGSSQEMVIEDDLSTMVNRPSLNRSISESYESKKATIDTNSTSVHSDSEDSKNISEHRLVDNLKSKVISFSMDSVESATGSIDSQRSCDSGFVDAGLRKFSTREQRDSFDDASEAIDTEDDSTTLSKIDQFDSYPHNKLMQKNKKTILGFGKSSQYLTKAKSYPGEKGCETKQTTSLGFHSKEVSANNGNLCNICNERPKDACFVHQKISHQFCCYKCAKKQYRINPVCPVCRRKVEKITRNILA